MEDFLISEGNLFSIVIKEKTDETMKISISDDFYLQIDLKKNIIQTQEEMLIDLCKNLNKKEHKDLTELFKDLTLAYGELMDPDSPLYKGQEVFELENDNNDIKFIDRIRFKQDEFHPDIWMNIFSFFDPEFLNELNLVSKLWLKLTRNENLWKNNCFRIGLTSLGKFTSWRDLYKGKEIKVVMFGLDQSGKTMILYHLKNNEVPDCIPTIGFNVETIPYQSIKLTIWDVGGQDRIRLLWKHYTQLSQIVIFVIDCNDRNRIQEVNDELKNIMNNEELNENTPLLIYANKQDLSDVMDEKELRSELKLNDLKQKNVFIQPCSGLTLNGVTEGLEWIIQQI